MYSYFCDHEWDRLIVTYAPPLIDMTEDISLKGFSKEQVVEMIHGATTLVIQCKKCKKFKKEICLGKEDK